MEFGKCSLPLTSDFFNICVFFNFLLKIHGIYFKFPIDCSAIRTFCWTIQDGSKMQRHAPNKQINNSSKPSSIIAIAANKPTTILENNTQNKYTHT